MNENSIIIVIIFISITILYLILLIYICINEMKRQELIYHRLESFSADIV